MHMFFLLELLIELFLAKKVTHSEGTMWEIACAGLSIRFEVGVFPYNNRQLWLFRWPKATVSRRVWGHAPQKNFKFRSSDMRFPAFLAWESKVNDEYLPLKEIYIFNVHRQMVKGNEKVLLQKNEVALENNLHQTSWYKPVWS